MQRPACSNGKGVSGAEEEEGDRSSTHAKGRSTRFQEHATTQEQETH